MAKREVDLTKRVQTPHGWRYCRVVLSANVFRSELIPWTYPIKVIPVHPRQV